MEYLLLKYLHILGFVYWLGGDLGTFIASKYMVNRNIGNEARAIATKIMLACDQGPKLAMPLMLSLGVHLGATLGVLPLPAAAVGLVWLLCAIWLINVLVLYIYEGQPFTAGLARFDFAFRIAMVLAIAVFLLADQLQPSLISADWMALKLLIFAILVSCGIGIRIQLKPFVPAFMRLMKEGPSDEVNSILERALSRSRPFVAVIWLGLFVSAALGVHLIQV
ncbi:MAG: hypothetical protein ACSHWQ_03805 [Spongiibacteraceae bacterium]